MGESHDRDAEGRTTAERKRLSGIRPRSRWPLSSSSRAFSGRCQGSSRLVSRHWPFGPADLSLSDMLVRVRTPRHAPAPSEHLTGLVTMVPLREPTFAGDLLGAFEEQRCRKMASGRTSRRRNPDRPGEPPPRTPEEDITVVESNTHTASPSPTGQPICSGSRSGTRCTRLYTTTAQARRSQRGRSR